MVKLFNKKIMGKKIIIKGADFYQNSLPVPGELRSVDFEGEWIQGNISADGIETYGGSNCFIRSFVDVTDTELNIIELNDCGLRLVFYDTNKDFISYVDTIRRPLSFTTPSETKYVRFSLWKPNTPITPTVADTLVWKVRKL